MPGIARVAAVSFDLWDTVFIDDSDEPKRKLQGLATKKVERRDLVARFLSGQEPFPRERVDRAYDAADEAFRKAWHGEHVTWTVAERLRLILTSLERTLAPERFAELVRLHEEMELRIQPSLVPGIADALHALRQKRRLVVVSDAVFTPGRALRKLLAGYGLLELFDGFVFSDEAGRSKPAPELFLKAASLAGCRIEELVHVGDREQNDIAGPQALGARAVLTTAAVDRGSAGTRADAVCADYRELAAIIESLDKAKESL